MSRSTARLPVQGWAMLQGWGAKCPTRPFCRVCPSDFCSKKTSHLKEISHQLESNLAMMEERGNSPDQHGRGVWLEFPSKTQFLLNKHELLSRCQSRQGRVQTNLVDGEHSPSTQDRWHSHENTNDFLAIIAELRYLPRKFNDFASAD